MGRGLLARLFRGWAAREVVGAPVPGTGRGVGVEQVTIEEVLEELRVDRRLDLAIPTVSSAGHDVKLLRLACGGEQSSSSRDGHDGIALPVNDQYSPRAEA